MNVYVVLWIHEGLYERMAVCLTKGLAEEHLRDFTEEAGAGPTGRTNDIFIEEPEVFYVKPGNKSFYNPGADCALPGKEGSLCVLHHCRHCYILEEWRKSIHEQGNDPAHQPHNRLGQENP